MSLSRGQTTQRPPGPPKTRWDSQNLEHLETLPGSGPPCGRVGHLLSEPVLSFSPSPHPLDASRRQAKESRNDKPPTLSQRETPPSMHQTPCGPRGFGVAPTPGRQAGGLRVNRAQRAFCESTNKAEPGKLPRQEGRREAGTPPVPEMGRLALQCSPREQEGAALNRPCPGRLPSLWICSHHRP